MQVKAPGKLILAGEHAVVYGLPALALAINRYAHITLAPTNLPGILFNCVNLANTKELLTIPKLQQLKQIISTKYRKFIAGRLPITQVLRRPIELAQFAVSTIVGLLDISITQGCHITIESDIPTNRGMGSSAALILALSYALIRHGNLQLAPQEIWHLAKTIENTQHGYSSGLDLHVSQQGQCVWWENNFAAPRPLPNYDLYAIDTGAAANSTGACVKHVAPTLRSLKLRQNFIMAATNMDRALQTNDGGLFIEMVKYNHQLLSTLGVVPQKVQDFIAEIMLAGGAAKISGAGAISGQNAGMVIAFATAADTLRDLCDKYQYQLLNLAPATQGVCYV